MLYRWRLLRKDFDNKFLKISLIICQLLSDVLLVRLWATFVNSVIVEGAQEKSQTKGH